MKTAVFVLAALVAAASADVNPANPTQTKKGVEQSAVPPQPNNPTTHGCFSSAGSMVLNGSVQYNTISSCGGLCNGMGLPVGATTGGNQCYCGQRYPPKDKLVADSNCNIGCSGFDWDACGGVNFWTVYNLGSNVSVLYDGEDTSSSGSGTATAPVNTVVVTTTNTASSGGGGPNTAGIAAGIVVAVVVVASALAGFFFYIRRRRNQEIEEEHRRNATINNFMTGGKPPGSSGGFSSSDARLDPVMAQRRLSDGSIADNQDYSRKILRVTNA